jgi:hypothetical protein
MFFYPNEQFPYTYLLFISAIVLFAFAVLRMTNRRAVWFLSISAPGILILPDYIVGEFALRQKEPAPIPIILGDAFLYLLYCPAVWAFPVIFFIQIRKLARSDGLPMTDVSYFRVVLLALLYPWCDIFFAFAHAFVGR